MLDCNHLVPCFFWGPRHEVLFEELGSSPDLRRQETVREKENFFKMHLWQQKKKMEKQQ